MRLAIPCEKIEAWAGFTERQIGTIQKHGKQGSFFLVEDYNTYDLYYLGLADDGKLPAFTKVIGDLGALFPVNPSLFSDDKYEEMLNPPPAHFWHDEDIDALERKLDGSVPKDFALNMLSTALRATK